MNEDFYYYESNLSEFLLCIEMVFSNLQQRFYEEECETISINDIRDSKIP